MVEIVQDLNVLRKESLPVASVEEATGIISQLEEILLKLGHGIGLSAIQIGINKQVGVIKGNRGIIHLINPRLVEAEDEFVYYKEGCLSFPNVFRNTKRYKEYTIINNIIDDGKFREEEWYFYYSNDPKEPGNNGIESIAVQHEMEHFKGGLILDHNIPSVQPIERTDKKVGRNDPCPCGKKGNNGKPLKFKKCCGK